MPRTSRARRGVAALCLTTLALSTPALTALPAHAAPGVGSTPGSGTSADLPGLPVPDDAWPTATTGFHDWTRTGEVRPVRDDLTGALAGQVELVQETTVEATGNAAAERPDLVAEREALLLLTPQAPTTALTVTASVGGRTVGTLPMVAPHRLPASDQNHDERGSVAYSLKAWSAHLPWQWVRPGLTLRFADASGAAGDLPRVDVAAPVELVVNNVQLGMLTHAPDNAGHRFVRNPAWGATDYFSTVPVSRLVMATYEKVRLDRVIVASGAVYDADHPAPGEGGVHSGDMRENVGKAQVSTGINLATWGITSSPMNQQQPQVTNQRVIHHSAGQYTNGRVEHGLSGGNGMATLYASVGNELSHELGHSYGLGHFPGTDTSKSGDDVIRNASHHMDSGWGWIGHRGLMRSNLSTDAYRETRDINGHPFGESLRGLYNFNTDAMSSGRDLSPVSDYTHHTGYSLKRIQNNLRTVVADTEYPSGYRAWDRTAGAWADAKAVTPSFDRPRPARVGGSVFTLLGGYNPARPEQAVLYPAFRSNHGVTFDLPQADPQAVSATRSCWLEVRYADRPTSYVQVGAGDGVKQVNVNVAESDRPTGAQLACRQDGTTTLLGDPVTIATDLPPMPAPVVVGQEAGYEALRATELADLQPKLAAQAGSAFPALSPSDTTVLAGWADDLSTLSPEARAVADRVLGLRSDAERVTAYLAAYGSTLGDGTNDRADTLLAFLRARGYADTDEVVLPVGRPVTVDGGKCLTLDSTGSGTTVRATTSAAGCTGSEAERWWVDTAGRIHAAVRPDLCLRTGTPVAAVPCDAVAGNQRWVLEDDGHVLSAANPSQAMDLYRSNHQPGMYGRSSGSNQIWKGFATSPNALLAHLGSTGLAALYDARVATVDVELRGRAGLRGWTVGRKRALVSAGVRLTGETVPAEVLVRDVWRPVGRSVVLPQGRSVLRVRAASPYGPTTEVSRRVRVDTVRPVVRARLGRTVRLRASDATSGVARVQYRTSPTGRWKRYAAPLRLPAGTRLQARARDRAGNWSRVLRVRVTAGRAAG